MPFSIAIDDEYAGLDIEKLQESFAGGEPHLKETTAMIRAGHQFVEVADRELLAKIDLARIKHGENG